MNMGGRNIAEIGVGGYMGSANSGSHGVKILIHAEPRAISPRTCITSLDQLGSKFFCPLSAEPRGRAVVRESKRRGLHTVRRIPQYL